MKPLSAAALAIAIMWSLSRISTPSPGVVAEVFKHEGGIVLQCAVLKKLQGGWAHSVRCVLVANGGHFGHEFIDRDRVSVDKGGENADVGARLAESVDGFFLVSDEQARVIVRGVAIGLRTVWVKTGKRVSMALPEVKPRFCSMMAMVEASLNSPVGLPFSSRTK